MRGLDKLVRQLMECWSKDECCCEQCRFKEIVGRLYGKEEENEV